MALGNKKLFPGAETVFLTTAAENMYLSSSIVKQIATLGGDISSFVPPEILSVIMERLYKNKKHSPSGGTASEQELRQVQLFANAIGKEESE